MDKQITNQITCPNCKTVISNHPLIDAAAKGEGNGSQHIICVCGERITFWAITAQLRDQKTFGVRIQNWFHTLSREKIA